MQEFVYQQLEDGTYCVMAYDGDEAEVTIPDTYGGAPITVLYDKLFQGHTEISSVHIPETVTDMGEFVFDGCENLRHLVLPLCLRSLWGHTFCRSGLEEIVLPEGLATIPPFAFKDCKKLRRVECGFRMRQIFAYAFAGCDQLTEVLVGPFVKVSPDAYSAPKAGA